MHHAQPSAKRLAIALGHWRERAGCSPSGGAISVAAAAALAHARARPDTLAYVSGHHPVVQALRRALAQDVPPPTPACRHPLPSCLSLADALSLRPLCVAVAPTKTSPAHVQPGSPSWRLPSGPPRCCRPVSRPPRGRPGNWLLSGQRSSSVGTGSWSPGLLRARKPLWPWTSPM